MAHPNVQQLLGAIWYDGLPGFRRKDMVSQCIEVGKLAAMFPILSIAYMINPNSDKGKFVKKPFVKFITHCGSYMFFLSELRDKFLYPDFNLCLTRVYSTFLLFDSMLYHVSLTL